MLQSDANEIVGYRFWFLVHDPKFSLARAVVNCWRTAAREMVAEKAKVARSGGIVPLGDDRSYLRMTSEELYMYGVASCYLRPLGGEPFAMDKDAMQTELNDTSIHSAGNKATPTTVFSLEHAIALCRLEDTLPRAAQLVGDNYDGRDFQSGDPTPIVGWPLEHLVFMLPRMTPGSCGAMAFPDASRLVVVPPLRTPESLDGAEADWHAYNESAAPEPAPDEDSGGDSAFHLLAESTKDQFSKALVIADDDERRDAVVALRSSQMENFTAIWTTTVPNLGRVLRIVIEWGEQQVSKALKCGREGWRVSRSESDCVPIDPSLSVFGNMMARRLRHYEEEMDVSVTHSVLELCLLSARNAYEHTFELGVTLLLLGKAEVGKSHLLKMIQTLSIPDTTTRPAYSTEKAHLHGSHENDTTMLHDEMPLTDFGTDNRNTGANTGNPVMKTTMASVLKILDDHGKCVGAVENRCLTHTLRRAQTEKKVTVEAFAYDEATGKRGMTSTTAERIGTRIYCTNEDFSRMPGPVQKRLMPVNIDTFNRKHRNVAS